MVVVLDGAVRVDGADELTKEEEEAGEGGVGGRGKVIDEERVKEEVEELEVVDDDDDDEEVRGVKEEIEYFCNTSMAETSFPARLDVGIASIWEVLSTPGLLSPHVTGSVASVFRMWKFGPLNPYAKCPFAVMVETKFKWHKL